MSELEKLDEDNVGKGNQEKSAEMAEGTNNPDNPDDEGSNDPWTELMGKDIQMKVLSNNNNNEQASKDDENDNSKGKECRPQVAAIIDFVGRLATNREDEDGPIFHQANDWLIVIGDKYVNPALEMGVRFMNEGQRAAIWSHSKFAYGVSTRKHGTYELPPSSNVRYEVHVKRVFAPEEGSTDPDTFQMKLAFSKKIIANDIFQNELYSSNNRGSEPRAIRLYQKAADEMMHLLQEEAAKKEKEGDAYDEAKAKEKTGPATEIMLDCLNNAVAVFIKSKKYHEAKEAAVKVLQYDPTNLKALLRAARAAMLDPAGSYEESDAAIAAAEKVVAEKGLDDKDVRKLRHELKQNKMEYKKKKKAMMARMTKELKPKEPEPQPPNDDKDGGPADPSDTEAEAENSDLSSVEPPLWSRLVPLAFQIIFTFVIYKAVIYMQQQGQIIDDQRDDEL